jgi:zinc-binding alcohol dehydrogenase/oxidoreductase
VIEQTPTPRLMRAAVCEGGPGGRVTVCEVPVPVPGPGEVLLRVDRAGLNRHDLFVLDRADDTVRGLVLGSDAVGEVVACGPGVDDAMLGRTVIVNPCLGWSDPTRPPLVPEVLGDPRPGTLAEYVALPWENVVPAPAHLQPDEAAGLGLAAMTAYRALFSQGGVADGTRVLVTGAGGGVAGLAITLAHAAGAWVAATSRSARALEHAAALGADGGVLDDADWSAELGDVDVVLDSVGAPAFRRALGTLRPGGRLVSFGATVGALTELDLRDLFFRQVSVTGSSMASAPEFAAMLAFVERHRIRPPVGAVHDLDDVETALADLRDGASLGKVVVRITRTATEEKR